MKASFQHGSVIRISNKSGDLWRFRWRDGEQHRSEFLGTLKQYPTKAKAQTAAQQRFGHLLNSNVEVITVADLIAKFWREAAPERETTAAGYRSIFGRIEKAWGKVRIDEMAARTAEIEQWLNTLEALRGGKRAASPLYRSQVRNLLHLLMEKAMLWGHLAQGRNPIELVRLKNASQRVKDIVTVTQEQYQQLLDDPELPQLVKVMMQVAASLGLRVSEILGLRWEDFDFAAGMVAIRRSVVGGAKYATKTAGSAQKLPVHEHLAAVLQAWKEAVPVVNGWVFGSARTGMPYDRDYLRSEYLQPAGERIGLDGLGWHSFRHTYRNLMRTSGVDLETQKSLMRHAKLSTTADVYGGEDDVERLREANSKVVNILTRRSA